MFTFVTNGLLSIILPVSGQKTFLHKKGNNSELTNLELPGEFVACFLSSLAGGGERCLCA